MQVGTQVIRVNSGNDNGSKGEIVELLANNRARVQWRGGVKTQIKLSCLVAGVATIYTGTGRKPAGSLAFDFSENDGVAIAQQLANNQPYQRNGISLASKGDGTQTIVMTEVGTGRVLGEVRGIFTALENMGGVLS